MIDEVTYRCAPAIAWVKDAGQTIVVDEETGKSWSLCGAEATIWDLLALSYPAAQIAGFLSVLLDLSAQEAAGTLSRVVAAWAQAGILCAPGEASHG